MPFVRAVRAEFMRSEFNPVQGAFAGTERGQDGRNHHASVRPKTFGNAFAGTNRNLHGPSSGTAVPRWIDLALPQPSPVRLG